MKRKLTTAGSLLLIIGLGIYFGGYGGRWLSRTLPVAYPFAILDASRVVLPESIQSTWQYYLLENLASGLVRDQLNGPSPYAMILADRIESSDRKTWTVRLRDGAKWSDGTSLVARDAVLSLQTAAQRRALHISLLRNAVFISPSEFHAREFTIQFPEPVSRLALLHELSVADTTIVSPKNWEGDWSVTSGAYAVKTISVKDGHANLQANPYSSLITDRSPRSVDLVDFNDKNLGDPGFAERVGLFSVSVNSFWKMYEPLWKSSLSRVYSAPSIIHFMVPASKKFSDLEIRKRKLILRIVNSSKRYQKFHDMLEPEDQLISPGFAGRLEPFISAVDEAGGDTKLFTDDSRPIRRIVLSFTPAYQSLPAFCDRLVQVGRDMGVEVVVRFDPFSSNEIGDSDMRLRFFKGNMADERGSWGYLLNSPLLGAPEALHKAYARDGGSVSTQKIHREILSQAWAIPMFREALPTFFRSGLDLSKWNPVDMRLRIYDVAVNRR